MSTLGFLVLDAIECPALTKTFLRIETGKTFRNRAQAFEQVELVSDGALTPSVVWGVVSSRRDNTPRDI